MKTFEVAPYGFRLHFSTVKAEMARVYKELTDRVLDTSVAGLAFQNGHDFYIAVFDSGPECIDTLAHEIGHSTIDMCAYIGYNPGAEQEPYCFLTGWITKTLMFAHPKFKEAMNEPVGIRAGNGRRRAPAGDGSHQQQRGSGESPQQPVCPSGLQALCNAPVGAYLNVPEREEAGRTSRG